MDNALFIAIAAGLGGMLGWGFADFFAKVTIDRIGPITSLVWAHLAGTSIFVLVFLYELLMGHEMTGPGNTSSWLALAGFGVLQMIVYWFAYQGFEKGKVSVMNPIFASYSGVVALLSIIFFNENFGVAVGVALTLIFVGNIVLNLDFADLKANKRVSLTPGVKEMVIAAVLAAVWTLAWDRYVTGRDPLVSALLMYAFMTVAAFLLAKLTKTKLGGVKSDLWKFLVLMGLGEAVAYLAISWGYSETSKTSVVALISGTFSVPTLILAYFFLKERISKLQVLAIVGILAGIVLLSLS
jgi:drug/metabolite transporter (DMT)-like permease